MFRAGRGVQEVCSHGKAASGLSPKSPEVRGGAESWLRPCWEGQALSNCSNPPPPPCFGPFSWILGGSREETQREGR